MVKQKDINGYYRTVNGKRFWVNSHSRAKRTEAKAGGQHFVLRCGGGGCYSDKAPIGPFPSRAAAVAYLEWILIQSQNGRHKHARAGQWSISSSVSPDKDFPGIPLCPTCREPLSQDGYGNADFHCGDPYEGVDHVWPFDHPFTEYDSA